MYVSKEIKLSLEIRTVAARVLFERRLLKRSDDFSHSVFVSRSRSSTRVYIVNASILLNLLSSFQSPFRMSWLSHPYFRKRVARTSPRFFPNCHPTHSAVLVPKRLAGQVNYFPMSFIVEKNNLFSFLRAVREVFSNEIQHAVLFDLG